MRIGGLREFSLSKWGKRNAGVKPAKSDSPAITHRRVLCAGVFRLSSQ